MSALKVDMMDVKVIYKDGEEVLAAFPYQRTVMPEKSDVIRLAGRRWTIEFMEADLDHGKVTVQLTAFPETA